MLIELNIRNFAIIDRLQVSIGPGLSVLTGETGAGKSIIIDAVGLLLGARARPELIRTGEEEATVEALFDLSAQPEVRQELKENGFDSDAELMVKRTISRAGKNRVYINGSLAKLAQLQAIAGRLLTIYGQHEHQQLQRIETHLGLLDRFAALAGEIGAYRHFFRELGEISARLQQLEAAERQRQQRLELLEHQSRELADAGLLEGEDEELAAERLLLQNAARLTAVAEGGHNLLYGAEGAVCENIGSVADDLEALAGVEPRFGKMAESLRTCQYTLEDAAGQLRSYGGQIAFDPERQAHVEARLAQLSVLKKKYAPTIGAIVRYQEEIAREIESLGELETSREELQLKAVAIRERLLQAGAELSLARRQAASRLQEAVEGELKDLLMEKARFEMRFFPLAEPGSQGLERGEFYLTPNPGEEPRPLAWIASGGELSRIMLALKRAAPESEAIPTLIFDEVDTGVGGTAATAVGGKLKGVADRAQVLCITHLPQVAAFADTHLRVEKQEDEGRTRTLVVHLDGEERVREMARMLGGSLVTEKTLEHAREIILRSAG
ncbi:MAG: DNA repair protein RecN [Desulfuromonadales bacterium]